MASKTFALLNLLSSRVVSLSFIQCDIHDSLLADLATWVLCACGQLEKLCISKNTLSISSIKKALGSLVSLQKLKFLSFEHNNLGFEDVHTVIQQIARQGFLSLQTLKLDQSDVTVKSFIRNCIPDFPPQRPSHDWMNLVNYLKLVAENSKNVRFMFMGDSTAGKTSLSQALRSETCTTEEIPIEKRTVGIDIYDLNLQEDLIARCWDFAGQEIYYLPHSMHLSSDCLYLLVFKCPKNDMEFESTLSRLRVWLALLSSNVAAANILLVGTHASNESLSPALKGISERLGEQVHRLNEMKLLEVKSLQDMFFVRWETLTSQLQNIVFVRDYLATCIKFLDVSNCSSLSSRLKLLQFTKILESHLENQNDEILRPFFLLLKDCAKSKFDSKQQAYQSIEQIIKNISMQLNKCFAHIKSDNLFANEEDVYQSLVRYNSKSGAPGCILELTKAAQFSMDDMRSIRQKLSSLSQPQDKSSSELKGLFIMGSFFVDSHTGFGIQELKGILLELGLNNTIFPPRRVSSQLKEVCKGMDDLGFLTKEKFFEKIFSNDLLLDTFQRGSKLTESVQKALEIRIWDEIECLKSAGDVFVYKDMFCSNLQLIVDSLKPLMLPSGDILTLCDRVTSRAANSHDEIPYLELFRDSFIPSDKLPLLERLAKFSVCSEKLLDIFVGWPKKKEKKKDDDVYSKILDFFKYCGLLVDCIDSECSDRKAFFVSAREMPHRDVLPDISQKPMHYHVRFDMATLSLCLFPKILSEIISKNMHKSINVTVQYTGNEIRLLRNECDCVIKIVEHSHLTDHDSFPHTLLVESNEAGMFRFAVQICEVVLCSGCFGLISRCSMKSFKSPSIQCHIGRYGSCPLSVALRAKVYTSSNTLEDKMLTGFNLERKCSVCVTFCGQGDGVTEFVKIVCEKIESITMCNVWLFNEKSDSDEIRVRIKEARIVFVFLTPEYILSPVFMTQLYKIMWIRQLLHTSERPIRIVSIPLHPAVSFHNLERIVHEKFHLCVPEQGSSDIGLQNSADEVYVYGFKDSSLRVLENLLQNQTEEERLRVDIWLQMHAWKRDRDSSKWYEDEKEIEHEFTASGAHTEFSRVCLIKVHAELPSTPRQTTLSLVHDIISAYKDFVCCSISMDSEPQDPWFWTSKFVKPNVILTWKSKFVHENQVFTHLGSQNKSFLKGELLTPEAEEHFRLLFISSFSSLPQYNFRSRNHFSDLRNSLFRDASELFVETEALEKTTLGILACLGLSDEEIIDVTRRHFTPNQNPPVYFFSKRLCWNQDVFRAPFFRLHQKDWDTQAPIPDYKDLIPFLTSKCPKVLLLVEGPDDLYFYNALFSTANDFVANGSKCSARCLNHAVCQDVVPILGDTALSFEFSVRRILDPNQTTGYLRMILSAKLAKEDVTVGSVTFKLPHVCFFTNQCKFLFPFEIGDNDLKFLNTTHPPNQSIKSRIDYLHWGRAIENYLLPLDASLRMFYGSLSSKALELTLEAFGCVAKHFFPRPPDDCKKFNQFCGEAWAKLEHESIYEFPSVQAPSLQKSMEKVLRLFYERVTRSPPRPDFHVIIEALEATFTSHKHNQPKSSITSIETEYLRRKGTFSDVKTFISRMNGRNPPFWKDFPSFSCFISFICCKVNDAVLRQDASSVLVVLQEVLMDLICRCPKDEKKGVGLFFGNLMKMSSGPCQNLCLLVGTEGASKPNALCATCGNSADQHVFQYSSADLDVLLKLNQLREDHVKFLNSLSRFSSICWNPHRFSKECHMHISLSPATQPVDENDVDEANAIYCEHMRANVFDTTTPTKCKTCNDYARDHPLPQEIINCTSASIDVLRQERIEELLDLFKFVKEKELAVSRDFDRDVALRGGRQRPPQPPPPASTPPSSSLLPPPQSSQSSSSLLPPPSSPTPPPLRPSSSSVSPPPPPLPQSLSSLPPPS
jgi:GTPase SAR1 family protein